MAAHGKNTIGATSSRFCGTAGQQTTARIIELMAWAGGGDRLLARHCDQALNIDLARDIRRKIRLQPKCVPVGHGGRDFSTNERNDI